MKISKAKKLAESLRAKTRRFSESVQLDNWFKSELKRLNPEKLSRTEVIEELGTFKGIEKAVNSTFKSTDKLICLCGLYPEIDDLADLLSKEGYNYKDYGWECTVYTNVTVNNIKTDVLVCSKNQAMFGLVLKELK